jgi:hypothetical protein
VERRRNFAVKVKVLLLDEGVRKEGVNEGEITLFNYAIMHPQEGIYLLLPLGCK